jgi:tRNA pseudouridine38-40 synthase
MLGGPGVSRLLLEYDGTRFAGWATQARARTVQAELEQALGVVLRRPPVPLTVAGRTDAGVHAWGQVASYSGPVARVAGLNALLPDDVAVLACEPAAPDFDARRDATSRAYCYRVLTRRSRSALDAGRAFHWSYEVELERLRACSSLLPGTHDFTAFTPTETYHTHFYREVFTADWRRAPGRWDLLEFWIEADSFMRRMNRVLVGTMLEVAAGQRSVSSFAALLQGARRSAAGRTAPAHGLFLAGVGYEGKRVLERSGADRAAD